MIKQISWADYWTVVAVLCAAYYVVVIFLFYRKELFDLVSGKLRSSPATLASPPTSTPHPAGNFPARTEEARMTEEEKLFALTNNLMQLLRPVFSANYVREEFIMALQQVVRRYPQLKGTAFQVSVNNYIKMESENQCSVSLSESELRGLW